MIQWNIERQIFMIDMYLLSYKYYVVNQIPEKLISVAILIEMLELQTITYSGIYIYIYIFLNPFYSAFSKDVTANLSLTDIS